MFVWYFKEENTLRFWRLCGRIEKTRRKETAVTLQQLRYVTAVAGTGTISHAVQQFYISQPSLTNAIRELEQEVGLALSKTESSVVSRTLLDARGQMSAKSMHLPAYGQKKCQKKKGVQEKMKHLHEGGCPGSRMRTLEQPETAAESVASAPVQPVSRLRNWPVQIKLAPVHAPYFEGAKLLIAADCTAYAYANFHQEFMRGKVTLIGCPKLDAVDYSEKLTEILRSNDIQSVTILRMEVPCCGGLEMAAKKALQTSGKFIPWQVVTISIDGKILD